MDKVTFWDYNVWKHENIIWPLTLTLIYIYVKPYSNFECFEYKYNC